MYHSPRDWLKISGMQFVDGRVQILGYMDDVRKLLSASQIRYNDSVYILASKPVRHGFGERYFVCFLDIV